MNLTCTLITLALLGLDDTTSKPRPAPKASAEMTREADGKTAPKTTNPDRILEGVQELKQVDQAHLSGSPLPKLLAKGGAPRTANGPEAAEAWPMTLRAAIMIGLDNSEVVRVISFGAQGNSIGGFCGNLEAASAKAGASIPSGDRRPGPIVIARLNADGDPPRFKAEVMAHVRSVEQQYWVLAFTQVQLWAAEQAVKLAQEVLNREQAELQVCRGTVADIAEAAERLEQFNLDRVTRTSDVLAAERNLRFILRLPPADNRRIVPVTPASEAELDPVWDTCLNEMLEQSPDVVQRKSALRKQRDAIAVASAKMVAGSVEARPGKQKAKDTTDTPNSNPQWSSHFMLPAQTDAATKDDPENRQRIAQKEAELEQVIRHQVHSLARNFRNIEANHQEFQTAKQLRVAAAGRLDAQRAYYEEGRVTIDRFLDAVSQYAAAVDTEVQYKATYSTSIVVLREAKGTLLADYGIVLAEGPSPNQPVAAREPKADEAAKRAAFVADAKNGPVQASAPASEATGLAPVPGFGMECVESTKPASSATTRTWTFSFTIGSGPGAVQLKGMVSADDRGTLGH